MDLKSIERALVVDDQYFIKNNTEGTVVEKNILEITDKILCGEYYEIWKLDPLKNIVENLPNKEERFQDEDPFVAVSRYLEDWLEDSQVGSLSQKQLLLLLLGISSLRIFLQNNWTGPAIQVPDIFPNFKGIIDLLEEDGEHCYKYIESPQYLAFASVILIQLTDFLSSSSSRSLWAARCAITHQRVLMGPTETLRKAAVSGYEKAVFSYPVESDREIASMIQLEYGILYHHYTDSFRARQHFLQAQEITGLVTQLSGAMGRRTKFQSFDLPQLVLLAKSKDPVDNSPNPAVIPETIQNPDPDAIQIESGIKFTDSVPDSEANLSVFDQCIILALCLDVKNRNPRHGLTWEEMRVYVERVLKNPNNWMVYSMGLLIRARLEFEKNSTKDKSCMQIQVLVDQHSSDLEKDTSVSVRIKYLHLLAFPPQILLKKELGQKWLSLGSAASAQKLFEQLEMWEDIVDCYIVRNLRDEAESLIRKCLETQPTSRLWCTLGDITGKEEYYEKAWALSQGRFSRAKRQLGKLAMQNQKVIF